MSRLRAEPSGCDLTNVGFVSFAAAVGDKKQPNIASEAPIIRGWGGHGLCHGSIFIERAKPDYLSGVIRRMNHTDIFTLIDWRNFRAGSRPLQQQLPVT